MHYSDKHKISWLLILIITFGSLQTVLSGDIDLKNPTTNCHSLKIQTSEADFKHNNEKSTVDYCQNFSACVAHYNCAPIQPSTLSQLSARVLVHLEDLAGNVALISRYPGLLKRPPKV